MAKRIILVSFLCLGLFSGAKIWWAAQQPPQPDTVFHVNVNMVQLDVAVTDKKGSYITALTPWDFEVYEDGIPQKLAAFGEENEAPRRLEDYPRPANGAIRATMTNQPSDRLGSVVAGANVFILFDTSNYMYRGFVFAQDAIAEFVRSLDHPYRVALYSYSRNFSRVCRLTTERPMALNGVRETVAGDDAALYDALLMTLKDAARFSGRRVIVTFSNGPDNASVVAPEDIRELAQTQGIAVYMISTQLARLDPVSTAVFGRIAATTGGKSYFAKNWQDQAKAFTSIRDDLAHLYTLAYYPQPNPNNGWRSIEVKLAGANLKSYHVRARSGYRPRSNRQSMEAQAASAPSK